MCTACAHYSAIRTGRKPLRTGAPCMQALHFPGSRGRGPNTVSYRNGRDSISTMHKPYTAVNKMYPNISSRGLAGWWWVSTWHGSFPFWRLFAPTGHRPALIFGAVPVPCSLFPSCGRGWCATNLLWGRPRSPCSAFCVLVRAEDAHAVFGAVPVPCSLFSVLCSVGALVDATNQRALGTSPFSVSHPCKSI
jgi:hypothetical protein